MALLTLLYVLYYLLFVVFLAGWKRAMLPSAAGGTKRSSLVSVVVPVRNEAHAIINLLEGLSAQEYRKFEVIVVDDHSTDETLWVLRHFPMENLKVVENKGEGKKSAIATGVRHARGQIVVTTDADCSVRPSWLHALHSAFRDPALMMVFGGVRMAGKRSFLDLLQEIEFSSLVGTAASTAALGVPTMCNGANLAFRKKVFNEVGGYAGNAHIPSGDDEFLLRKVRDRYPHGVRFLNDGAALVTTVTQPDTRTLFQQRLRWASKWRYNSSAVAKGLGIAVVAFQIAFLANWALIFSPLILHALFLIALKMILEAAFLLQVCRFTETRWNWLAFLALQILHPLYVVTVAVVSFFIPYGWKDRVFKPEKLLPGRPGSAF